MKEYKIVSTMSGFMKKRENIEELLNKHAREGWELKHVDQHMVRFILERDKNR